MVRSAWRCGERRAGGRPQGVARLSASHASALECLAEARALQPLITAESPRIEAARALTPEVLDALHAAGLFRLLVPRDLGGGELSLSQFVPVVAAIGAADGSVGWCVAQGSGCSIAAAYLQADAAAEIFASDSRAVVAWGAGAGGTARTVPGGWRVSGRWSYASGSRHATWLGGLCSLTDEDGAPTRTLLWPRREATLIDDWHVMGLRGTGSDTCVVSDLFVPTAHSFDRGPPPPRPGVLYRTPLGHAYPVGFAAVALGIARGLLDALVALARGKTPRGGQAMRDSGAIHSILGQLFARHGSAQAGLVGVLRDMEADFASGSLLTPAHELALRMATTFAIHEAVAVADAAFHEAGATAVHVGGSFERRLRDIHALAQQVQARRANYEAVGARLLGGAAPPLFI